MQTAHLTQIARTLLLPTATALHSLQCTQRSTAEETAALCQLLCVCICYFTLLFSISAYDLVLASFRRSGFFLHCLQHHHEHRDGEPTKSICFDLSACSPNEMKFATFPTENSATPTCHSLIFLQQHAQQDNSGNDASGDSCRHRRPLLDTR